MNDLSTLTHNQLIDAFANLEDEICKAQNSPRGVTKQLNRRYENYRAELLRRLDMTSNAGNLDAGNMTVILFDKRNVTRVRLENVEQIQAMQSRINGRLTNVWSMVCTPGGYQRAFPMRHYEIEVITTK